MKPSTRPLAFCAKEFEHGGGDDGEKPGRFQRRERLGDNPFRVDWKGYVSGHPATEAGGDKIAVLRRAWGGRPDFRGNARAHDDIIHFRESIGAVEGPEYCGI